MVASGRSGAAAASGSSSAASATASGLLRAPGVEPLGERSSDERQHRGREQRRIDRAGLADGQRADRNAGRHLHDREQASPCLPAPCVFDRHAEHRQRRHRRRHAGQMRRAAGAGDDHLEAAAFGAAWRIRRAARACGGPRRSAPRSRSPSASSVSAACRIVAQSDWLPMMIATGFDAILLPEAAIACGRKRRDYRLRLPAGKAKGVFSGAQALRFASKTRSDHGPCRKPKQVCDDEFPPAALRCWPRSNACKRELAVARARVGELEARADIDPLLDILNRRGFERELKRALAHVKRYGTQAGADVRRPRRLQSDQRPPRPWRRRRAAQGGYRELTGHVAPPTSSAGSAAMNSACCSGVRRGAGGRESAGTGSVDRQGRRFCTARCMCRSPPAWALSLLGADITPAEIIAAADRQCMRRKDEKRVCLRSIFWAVRRRDGHASTR